MPTPVTDDVSVLPPPPPPSCDAMMVREQPIVRVWSVLSAASQAFLIQDWITRPWPSLRVFCSSHLLDYQSVTHIFQQLGVTDRSSFVVTQEAHQRANDSLADATVEIANSVKLAALKVRTKLLETERVDIHEMTAVSSRMSTDALKLAMAFQSIATSQQVASASEGNGVGTGPVINLGSFDIPKKIKRSIEKSASEMGEILVRQQQPEEKKQGA